MRKPRRLTTEELAPWCWELKTGGTGLQAGAILNWQQLFGNSNPVEIEVGMGKGLFLLTQALAPRLADGARVANITSQLGSIANTTRFGTPSYNISKAAQNMATALLAQALGPRGIVVVALHPGWVRTDMGGKDATLPADESAAALLAVLDGLEPDDSGRFLDWRGAPLPW